ncbi:hypothetical protein ABT112_07315 [Streptomyces sp. NPDC002055]|uniref:hypothetical protein n=1 Tax=Streptomyces sp. NPDC002055 TaxID=3154534 RepID=UPI003326E1B7
MSSSPTPAPPPGTERQLREALEALVGDVHAAPGAYRAARGDWLRRERRRRMVLAALVTVLFTLATLIGLWVLNQVPAEPGVIFDDTPGGQHRPVDRTGTP